MFGPDADLDQAELSGRDWNAMGSQGGEEIRRQLKAQASAQEAEGLQPVRSR